MTTRTRWAGRCGVLSLGLAVACGSASKQGNEAASAGSIGDSSGSSNQAGTSAAGAGSAGTAGASQADAGEAGAGEAGGPANGAGAAGRTSEGGASNGGEAQGGSAGRGNGGSGGTTSGDTCTGARVLFLIQRSGALFEQPGPYTTEMPLPLEDSYYGFLQAALVGDGSAAKPYDGKLAIGVSFLFASRGLGGAAPVMCPQLTTTAPSLQSESALATAFTQSAADHAALVTAKQKEEAPVPEGIASAVAAWSGAGGQRHLVLVTTAMPDTCSKFDGPCGVDATVKAVQDARAAGVTTHVIGLGDDGHFDYSPNPESLPVTTGYEEYLQQLANAGRGKPLGPPNVEKVQDYVCDGPMPAVLTASYVGIPGDAKYYQVMTATDAKNAVAEILTNICP